MGADLKEHDITSVVRLANQLQVFHIQISRQATALLRQHDQQRERHPVLWSPLTTQMQRSAAQKEDA